MTTRIHKKIVFTGEYNKLKSMGFGFQKLYAGNYMQWAKETTEHLCDTRVWKKGAEVTIDELTNYEGFFLAELLAYKERGDEIKLSRIGTITFVKDPVTRHVSFDKATIDAVRDEELAGMQVYVALEKAFPTPKDISEDKTIGSPKRQAWYIEQRRLGEEVGIKGATQEQYQKRKQICHIDPKDLEPLKQFIKLGWVHVREFNVRT